MTEERHDPVPDVQRAAAYCTTAPIPGQPLGASCGDCGHAVVLHVGVTHCPVCELTQLNDRAREGLAAGRVEVTVHGEPVDHNYLVKLLERQALRRGRLLA